MNASNNYSIRADILDYAVRVGYDFEKVGRSVAELFGPFFVRCSDMFGEFSNTSIIHFKKLKETPARGK